MKPFGGVCVYVHVCACMCALCICLHVYVHVCVYTFTKADRLSPRMWGQPYSKWTETAGHSPAVGALETL